jgi:ElaA protein
MEFYTKNFDQLTRNELYALLQLRSEVFVVEQDCVYQDVDGKDSKALHLLGFQDGQLLAYARLFRPGDYFAEASIGRVVVKQSARQFGYGHQLMKAAVEVVEKEFNTPTIQISAQRYLEKFYTAHGFITFGEPYLEDGIPHIAMLRK